MRKLILVLTCLAILIEVSFRDHETKTVIIEKEVEKPKAESNGTSLSIDKNGVEFSTKKEDDKKD